LSQREARNYQFDFLRPNHSLFNYFSKLVEHYNKVLVTPRHIKDTLQVNASDKAKVISYFSFLFSFCFEVDSFFFFPQLLERVTERAEWTTYQETERKRAEEEAEKEREAYAAIDWHDFAVIGAIEFTGEEDVSELPPPVTLAALQKRSLVEKKTMPLIQPAAPRAASPARNEIQVFHPIFSSLFFLFVSTFPLKSLFF